MVGRTQPQSKHLPYMYPSDHTPCCLAVPGLTESPGLWVRIGTARMLRTYEVYGDELSKGIVSGFQNFAQVDTAAGPRLGVRDGVTSRGDDVQDGGGTRQAKPGPRSQDKTTKIRRANT